MSGRGKGRKRKTTHILPGQAKQPKQPKPRSKRSSTVQASPSEPSGSSEVTHGRPTCDSGNQTVSEKDVKMKVNFLLVGLILLRETSNGHAVPNRSGIMFLDKPCLSICKAVRCRSLDVIDIFEKLCNEETKSKGENAGRFDVNFSKTSCCFSLHEKSASKPFHYCGDEAKYCAEETKQTCGMEISGDKFEVMMFTSCCGDEAIDCTDYDDDSRLPAQTTSTKGKMIQIDYQISHSKMSKIPTLTLSPSINGRNPPSTSTKYTTEPSTSKSTNDRNTPSTSTKYPTEPSASKSTNDRNTPSSSTKYTTEPSQSATEPPDSTDADADTTTIGSNGLARNGESLHANKIFGGLLGALVITVVVVVVWWSNRRHGKIDQEAISGRQNLANLKKRDRLLSSLTY